MISLLLVERSLRCNAQLRHRADVLYRIHQITQVVARLEFTELVLCLALVLLPDEGVENCLLTFSPARLRLALNVLANCFELGLNVKLIDEVREVLDVVLVVHFGVLLEDDELVDG